MKNQLIQRTAPRPNSAAWGIPVSYGMAVLMITAAFALTWSLEQWVGPRIFIVFIAAVVTSAIYGGLGPGLLATALGALGHEYLITHPRFKIVSDAGNIAESLMFVGISAIMLAIVEYWRRAEYRASREQERFIRLAETTPDILFILDRDNDRMVYMNNQLAPTLGYSLDEFQAMGPDFKERLVHPDDLETIRASHRRADQMKEGAATTYEFRMRHADGSYRWLRSRVVVFSRTREGRAREIMGIAHDITEQKAIHIQLLNSKLDLEERVEARTAELRESEERYRLLVDAVRDYAIFMLDLNGIVTTWNAGAERITGYRQDEMIGKHVSVFYTAEDIHDGKPDTLLAEAQENGRAEYEGWRVRKDGSQFWADTVFAAVYDARNRIRGYAQVMRDMTQRRQEEMTLRQHEEELLQSRKLEALGRLAGGVAHDFNNMLTGIIGIASDLLSDTPKEDVRRGEYEEIMQASDRAVSLTKQLLSFGSKQIASTAVLNLNPFIQDMEKTLRRLVGEEVELLIQLSASSGHVQMDPSQVEQVLINLVLNARDAISEGGRIVLQTSNVDLGETYTARHFELKPGPYVLLTIAESGSAYDETEQENIFEPFFTTKQKTHGTGLGLATVYGIVKQTGGDIFLSSKPGASTTFKIYLPRVADRTQTEPANVSRHPTPRGTETILLVEDENIVRKVTSRALQKQGYRVLESGDGKEALEVTASYERPIHLLLTDVVLPGLNGRELAEILSSARPEMKTLYMSGYTEDAIVHRGVLKPGIDFIEKTFTPDLLCRRVREVLDKPQLTPR